MNAPTPAALVHQMRPQLVERRMRLQAAAHSLPEDYVSDLLAEIDAALAKVEHGTYGLCETCNDPIEADRLEANPLARFCLDHLTPEERRAHEQDMELATRIQAALLPARTTRTTHWETHYRYEPAGLVGGDYCEITASRDDSSLFFALGDVAGKGVAASLLMTHLSAIFRSLLPLDLPLAELMSRANRLFCESTPATHYATLVAGRAAEDGIDLCNAGHCRPLVLQQGGPAWIDPTGLPLGLFCDGQYAVKHVPLERGESIVLYSDGITEAQDLEGNTFDEERLLLTLLQFDGKSDPTAIADTVLSEVTRFRSGRPSHDDVTLLIVRRHS